MDGKMFISPQSLNFLFVKSMIKALFPICTLTWRVNISVSRQAKGMNKRDESSILIIYEIITTLVPLK